MERERILVKRQGEEDLAQVAKCYRFSSASCIPPTTTFYPALLSAVAYLLLPLLPEKYSVVE